MADRMEFIESDPRHYTVKLKGLLTEVIHQAREDVKKINDPKAQALFETIAEVLTGLRKAFDDFEEKQEEAWRKAG